MEGRQCWLTFALQVTLCLRPHAPRTLPTSLFLSLSSFIPSTLYPPFLISSFLQLSILPFHSPISPMFLSPPSFLPYTSLHLTYFPPSPSPSSSLPHPHPRCLHKYLPPRPSCCHYCSTRALACALPRLLAPFTPHPFNYSPPLPTLYFPATVEFTSSVRVLRRD